MIRNDAILGLGSIDKTWVIIGSSVSGIFVIGLVVILISRLLVELHYHREYQSFLRAQQQTEWKEVTHNVVLPLCNCV